MKILICLVLVNFSTFASINFNSINNQQLNIKIKVTADKIKKHIDNPDEVRKYVDLYSLLIKELSERLLHN